MSPSQVLDFSFPDYHYAATKQIHRLFHAPSASKFSTDNSNFKLKESEQTNKLKPFRIVFVLDRL